MASEELVNFLKQGPQIWNSWRSEHPGETHLDLTDADLSELSLAGANLYGANLRSACLSLTNLSHTNLTHADMTYANLSQANLRGTDLRHAVIMYASLDNADLSHANLSRASLVEADLSWTNLQEAQLIQADLTGSVLCGTLFLDADVIGVDFTGTTMYQTVLSGLDLREAGGLHSVLHLGPSNLSVGTIVRSHGMLPEAFLRGTGTPDTIIQALRSLGTRSLEYFTCYFYYSHHDKAFSEQLYTDLLRFGLRCWLSPKYTDNQGEAIKNPLSEYVEASMKPNDRVVLILSNHSLHSSWVKKVISNTLEREAKVKHQLLFLCQLDHPFPTTESLWLADLLKTHQIIDFQSWETKEIYDDKILQLLTKIQEG